MPIADVRPSLRIVKKNTINTRKTNRLKAKGRIHRSPKLTARAYEKLKATMKKTGLNRQDALSKILIAIDQGNYIDHIGRYAPPMSEETRQMTMTYITAEADEVLDKLKMGLPELTMSQIICGTFEIDEVLSSVIKDNPPATKIPSDGPEQIRYKTRLKSQGYEYVGFDVCLDDRNFIKQVANKHNLSLQDAVSRIVTETYGGNLGKPIQIPTKTIDIPNDVFNRRGYKFRKHWLTLDAVRVFKHMKKTHDMTHTQTLSWAINNYPNR